MNVNSTHIYGENYFGFVYLWFDKKRKIYYIGSHMGSVDDGYICSSKIMRDNYSYRPETFKRRIIYYLPVNDRVQLFEEEYRWLQMIKPNELQRKYYNKIRTANAPPTQKEIWTEKNRDEQSDRMKKAWTEERKKAHSEKLKKKWAEKDGKYVNRKIEFTDERRKQQSEIMTNNLNKLWADRDDPATKKMVENMSKSAKIRANTPEHIERFNIIVGNKKEGEISPS
jgi:hypothetical protein